MATAEKVSFVESSRVLLQLVEKTVPAVNATQEEAPSTSSRRKSKVQMLVQAPRLTEDPSKNGAPKDFLDLLVAYMNSMVNLSVTLANNQATIAQSQTDMSKAFVAGASAAATAATNALQKLEQDQEHEQHLSVWQKILGYVGAVVMCFVGIALENPSLFVMGALMMVDQATGATNALTNYLANNLSGLPSWAKDVVTVLVKVVIAFVLAIAVGGICGGMQALAEQMMAKGATVGAEAGAAAAASAANASAGAASAAGAAGADGAAANQQSFWSRAFEYGFKNGKGFMGYGQFVSTFAQMTLIVNPFVDMIQASMNVIPGISDETKKLIAQIGGLVVAMIAAFIAGRYSGLTGAANLQEAVAKATSYTTEAIAKGAAGGLLAGTMIANGVVDVILGTVQLDQSEATRKFGAAQSLQFLFTTLVGQITQMSKQTQTGGNGVNNAIASMNDRWSEYVEPYRLTADIAG